MKFIRLIRQTLFGETTGEGLRAVAEKMTPVAKVVTLGAVAVGGIGAFGKVRAAEAAAPTGSRAEGACVKALGALLREGDAVAKAAEAKALEEGSKDPSKRRLQTLQATLDQACARFVRGKIDAQIWAEVGGGSLPATCTVSSYRAQGEAKASQALDAKEEARRKAS